MGSGVFDLIDNLYRQKTENWFSTSDTTGTPGYTIGCQYDLLGELTSASDPDATDTYTYNKLGQATSGDQTIAGLTPTVTLAQQFDADGNRLQLSAAIGSTADFVNNYVYDADGQMTEVAQSGQATQPGQTGSNAVAEKRVVFSYDLANQWTSIDRYASLNDTSKLVATGNYAFDDLGRLTGRLMGSGVFDLIDNLYRQKTENWFSTSDATGTPSYAIGYHYDLLGELTSASDPDATDTTTYNKLGQAISGDQTIAGLTSTVTLAQQFDADGNRLQLSAAIGSTADFANNYVYDANGQMTEVAQSAQATQPGQTGSNAVAAKRVVFSYDLANAWTSIDRYASLSDTSKLVATGNYTLDDLGRLTGLSYSQGGNTLAAYQWTFDAASRITQQQSSNDATAGNAWGVTNYSYDFTNQLLGATYANFANAPTTDATFLYDANGNQTQGDFTVAATGDNQMATGAGYSYQYDGEGNRTARWTNNHTGVSETSPQPDDTNITTYQWDNRNRLGRLMGSGVFDLIDNLYRQKTENWLSTSDTTGTPGYTIGCQYDLLGELTSASDPDATDTYTYNKLGQATSGDQTIAGLTPTVTLAQQFDADGNRLQLSAAIGSTADFVNNYVYDADGQMTEVAQSAQATQPGQTGSNAVAEKRVVFSYDLANQWTSIDRYASLSDASKLVATGNYAFDDLGRLTGLTYTQGGSTLSAYQWSYDAASRITQQQSSSDATAGNAWGVTTYSYDPTNQLLGATYANFANAPTTDATFLYDANGNQTQGDFTVAATGDNQMATGAGYSYQYDGEGNRTARWTNNHTGVSETSPQPDDTDITTYQWDNRNRLVTVQHFATYSDYSTTTPTNPTWDQAVQFTYDFANRWIGETVTTIGQSTTVTERRFAYDGNQIVLEFDKTGTDALAASDLSHRYLWGSAVDQILADEQVSSMQAPGNVLWTLTDAQNTVRDLAVYNPQTNATTIANHLVFDAFGQATPGANPCLIGYTGRPFDEATGEQNNLNRWYEAVTHRWLSQDPMAADQNLYRYCGNNPVIHVDPSGMVDFDLGGLVDPDDMQQAAALQAAVPSDEPAITIPPLLGKLAKGIADMCPGGQAQLSQRIFSPPPIPVGAATLNVSFTVNGSIKKCKSNPSADGLLFCGSVTAKLDIGFGSMVGIPLQSFPTEGGSSTATTANPGTNVTTTIGSTNGKPCCKTNFDITAKASGGRGHEPIMGV